MVNALDYAASWLKFEAYLALSNPPAAWDEFWVTFGPGGRLHPKYFLEHQYHLVIEALLIVSIGYLLFQSRAPAKAAPDVLTEKEIDTLVQEWKSAPLVPEQPPAYHIATPVVEGMVGGSRARITVNGVSNVLNFTSQDFWGLSTDPEILENNRETIEKYGVGSCGPRGFYGTLDVHLTCEECLASFMGTAEAIVYSYDITMLPSVLPAFASRKDVIVMDAAASWQAHNGASLSRAKVLKYKHNDLEDLEHKLATAVKQNAGKPLNRRFIVVEGISTARGDVAPLAAIHALKEKYKFRLIVDETLSFGVLGSRGRGACEAAGLAPGDIEIITGSLSTCLGSVGGFCVGEHAMVDHQRLSGSGYCYSASLPPVLAASAEATLRKYQECEDGPALAASVRANARHLRSLLHNLPNGLVAVGDAERDADSPAVVFELPEGSALQKNSDMALEALARVRDALLSDAAILTTLQRPTTLNSADVRPALKAFVTARHDVADIERLAAELKRAASKVLKQFPASLVDSHTV